MQHGDVRVLGKQDPHGIAEPVAIALDFRQGMAQRGLMLQQQADRAEVGQAPRFAHHQAERMAGREAGRCFQDFRQA
ncbi:hypothetical protein D3C72_2287820 [compost metagenome]